MIHKDIYNIFTLIANDKYIRTSALFLTTFTIAIAIFFSPLAGLIIYCCYIFGYIVCFCLFKYQNNTSIYLSSLLNFLYSSNQPPRYLQHSCSICDDLTCERHQTYILSAAPWKNLKVPKALNNSIAHFYNKILENFITSWYHEFTADEDFVNQLRYCLRHATSTIINRFLELNHAKIISSKLLPYTIKHIDDYVYMQQIVKLKHTRFDDVIIDYLGKRLHAATTNRKNELTYLQNLAAALLPHILPDKYLKCRNYSVLIREIVAGWVLLPLMDVLADPNIINSLVILAINYKPKKNQRVIVDENVEFLDKFITKIGEASSFAVDLNSIKENQDLLYCFMQFLKREGHVHLLQFCLEVDEFNNKLLTPDLGPKDLEELHSSALIFYREYFNQGNVSFIGCSKQIIDEFYELVKEGVHNIGKLRTSRSLYQAYEYTLSVLESDWLPAFFHSNEYYSNICGSKFTADYNKDAINKTRKYYETPNQTTVSKISSGFVKIKGALRTNQPIDGEIFPNETQIENGTIEDIMISGSYFRNLSAWRTSILSYQTNNKIVSFCINVQRLDAIDDCNKHQWIVMRKDLDFYTLKTKLVEFHGETEICDSPLPSRKTGTTIDVRMMKYEDFLKKLMQKPSLRGSDLLYLFLTAKGDFTAIASAPNGQDLGNIYQNVAHRLRKEKGQHLDSFMSTFLSSTSKNKSIKIEWGDEVDVARLNGANEKVAPFPKTYRNYVFNDNFGIIFKVQKDAPNSSFNAVGITQCLFYLLKYVFNVPYYIVRLFTAICSVAHEPVEAFSMHLIRKNLNLALSPTNLTYLINLLEDVIFNPHKAPTKKELEERKVNAFKDLENILPNFLEKILGQEFNNGSKLLLEILQHPHYNKQLIYNLFDLVFLEMYPALGTNK